MECNKDEALRAKGIAEKKFEAKDIEGTMKFALKAQNLYPALDGISQMVATMEVYIASERRIYGEKDWYAILSISPVADDDTLRKQYRKLALLLHPDKNKSVGAEGAFQFISEAWNVLSDKSKRSLYDLKRGTKGLQPRPPPSNNERSAPTSADVLFKNAKNGTNNAAPGGRAPKSTSTPRTAAQRPAAAPRPAAASQPFAASGKFSAPRPTVLSDTFWTCCWKCKVHYEYLRSYINQNLICNRCHEPFIAKEVPVKADKTKYAPVPGTGSSRFQQMPYSSANPNINFPYGPFSRTAGSAGASAFSTAAEQAANFLHQAQEKVRRQREEPQTASRFTGAEDLQKKVDSLKRKAGFENPNEPYRAHPSSSKFARPAKKRSTANDVGAASEAEHVVPGIEKSSIDGLPRSTFFNCSFPPGMGMPNMHSSDFSKYGVNARQVNLSKQLLHLNTKNLLKQKAKVSICKKLEEWNSSKAANAAEKEKPKGKRKECKSSEEANTAGENLKKKQKHNGTVKKDVKDGSFMDDADEVLVSRSSGVKVPFKKDFSNGRHAESDNEDTVPVIMTVPDPDFHDFDKDRSEKAFDTEQIWATYDDEDGMPRYYALIQKVISLKPFKIRMSFLTSKSNSEFGPSNWVAYGFPKSCGDFRIGKYELKNTLNMFSHKVKWEKGPKGVIKILPRKGEIWALYRNWSSDWDEHTPDDVVYKYDMVEIVEDYNEEQGVSVVPLLKVAGFKTVFHRHLNLKEVKQIPREEMFRLSHQVPCIVLTGEEGDNAPKGCYELDPAATPVELLQVITEAKDGVVLILGEQQPDRSL